MNNMNMPTFQVIYLDSSLYSVKTDWEEDAVTLFNYIKRKELAVVMLKAGEINEPFLFVSPSFKQEFLQMVKPYLHQLPTSYPLVSSEIQLKNTPLTFNVPQVTTANYSISFRISIPNVNNGWRNVFLWGQDSTQNLPSIWVVPNSTGLLFEFYILGSTSAPNNELSEPTINAPNEWNHYTLTLSAGQQFSVFRNGDLIIQKTLSGTFPVGTTQPIWLPWVGLWQGRQFSDASGIQFSNLQVWSVPLTSDQAKIIWKL